MPRSPLARGRPAQAVTRDAPWTHVDVDSMLQENQLSRSDFEKDGEDLQM